MKYMTLISSAEDQGPPPLALMDEIMKLGVEGTRNGTLVQMGGLGPMATGARVELRGGQITVVDGPYAEAKEVVGGFAVFELRTKEEAVEVARNFMELHRKHWPGFEGVTEVRPIFG
jgi:hypothetical protein